MRIFVCASRSSYGDVARVCEELERRGHVTTPPNNYDDPSREDRVRAEGKDAYREWKASMLRMQIEKVEANDAVLVVNVDKGSDRNYIGGATFLEVFKAWELGKRVYLLNPIPENGFGDEIAAMQPEVLHGDLSAIS